MVLLERQVVVAAAVWRSPWFMYSVDQLLPCSFWSATYGRLCARYAAMVLDDEDDCRLCLPLRAWRRRWAGRLFMLDVSLPPGGAQGSQLRPLSADRPAQCSGRWLAFATLSLRTAVAPLMLAPGLVAAYRVGHQARILLTHLLQW